MFPCQWTQNQVFPLYCQSWSLGGAKMTQAAVRQPIPHSGVFCMDLFPWKFGIILLIEAEWHIYASVDQTIIGSDNGLSPGGRQAIIKTNAGIL